LDDRRNHLSVDVIQNYYRPPQVRTAFATAGIGTVTERALDAVERFAPFNLSGISRRPWIIASAQAAPAPTRRRNSGSRVRSLTAHRYERCGQGKHGSNTGEPKAPAYVILFSIHFVPLVGVQT